METFIITTDREHEAAIKRLIELNQSPNSAANLHEITYLADAVERYEVAAGHVPPAPQTLRGLLEVEMFKRRIKQRQLAELLEVTETRLSEVMRGKREMNLDLARKLHSRLGVPGDTLLELQH